MKIGIVSTPFLPTPPNGYGGTELFVYTLAKELTRMGHEIVLFATGDSTKEFSECGFLFPKHRWPIQPDDEIEHLNQAFHFMNKRDDIDVLHINSPYAVPIFSKAAAPVAVTMHHQYSPAFTSLYNQFPSVRVVSISDNQAALSKIKVPITTIHHGLDTTIFSPVSVPKKNYVLYLGRITKDKGPDLAIQAALKAGHSIVLAGGVQDCDKEFFNTMVVPYLADKRVSYIGEKGLEEKVALLREARALLMPLRWDEPFGLVMIEAILCGCPVVAFPRGSAPEIVKENITGFLTGDIEEMAFTIRKNIARIDRNKCSRYGRMMFSAQTMASRYETLFRDMIRRRLNGSLVETTA